MNYDRYNLLVVDNNPYVAGILAKTLESDFDITVVDNGQDAARLLVRGNRFDCILTELELPHFSGLDITKLVRTNRLLRHTPIVVLSNAADSNTRIDCLEQGVDHFISKPFNPLEVKARLRAVLRRAALPVHDDRERFVVSKQRSSLHPLRQLKSRILSILL